MSLRPHLTPGTDDELNWLAFRYVAGEMTREELASFERRLVEDLSACEAVAAMTDVAVCSHDAVAAEALRPVRRVEDCRSRPGIRSWVAVGSTLVALGWLLMLLSGQQSPSVVELTEIITQSDSHSAADLIARWSQVDEIEVSEELLDILPIEVSGNDSDPPEIPGWMIAAVSLAADEAPAEEMPDMPSKGNPVEMKEN